MTRAPALRAACVALIATAAVLLLSLSGCDSWRERRCADACAPRPVLSAVSWPICFCDFAPRDGGCK
jgi:uncharacterized iron-regulated membrane protein